MYNHRFKSSLLFILVFATYSLFQAAADTGLPKPKKHTLKLPAGTKLVYAIQDPRGAYLAVAAPVKTDETVQLYVDQGKGFKETHFTSLYSALLSPDGTKLAWIATIGKKEPSYWVVVDDKTYGPLRFIDKLFWSFDSRHIAYDSDMSYEKTTYLNGEAQGSDFQFLEGKDAWILGNSKEFSIHLSDGSLMKYPFGRPYTITASPDGQDFVFFSRRRSDYMALGKDWEAGPFLLGNFLYWDGQNPIYAILTDEGETLHWKIMKKDQILNASMELITKKKYTLSEYDVTSKLLYAGETGRYAYVVPSYGAVYIHESNGVLGPFSAVDDIAYSDDGSTFIAAVRGFGKTSTRARYPDLSWQTDAWIIGDGYRISLESERSHFPNETYFHIGDNIIDSITQDGSSILINLNNNDGPNYFLHAKRGGERTELLPLGQRFFNPGGNRLLQIVRAIHILDSPEGKWLQSEGIKYGPFHTVLQLNSITFKGTDKTGQWLIHGKERYGPFEEVYFSYRLPSSSGVDNGFLALIREKNGIYLRNGVNIVAGPFAPEEPTEKFKPPAPTSLNSGLDEYYRLFNKGHLSVVLTVSKKEVLNLTLISDPPKSIRGYRPVEAQ